MISRRNITTSIIHIPYAQTIKSYNCERGAGGVNYTEKLCKILKQYFSTSLLPAIATIKIEKLIIIILMSKNENTGKIINRILSCKMNMYQCRLYTLLNAMCVLEHMWG